MLIIQYLDIKSVLDTDGSSVPKKLEMQKLLLYIVLVAS